MPKSIVHGDGLFISETGDPLKEIFLTWISTKSSRKHILLSDSSDLGFAIVSKNNKMLCAIQLIGIKPRNHELLPQKKPADINYCILSSEDEDQEPETTPQDAAISFRLTG